MGITVDLISWTFLLAAGVLLFPPCEAPRTSTMTFCRLDSMKSGLEYAGSNKLVWSVMVGISVPVRCTAPKYHDGPSRLTCMDLGKWSEPQPPCKQIICETLTTPYRGKVEIQSWEVGSKAVYSCKEGYWYEGTNPRICQSDETWTGEDGHCLEVSCPSPKGVVNGTFIPGPPYKYKSRLKAVCFEGFVYNGSQELVCLTDNTWGGTVGQCLDIKKITCRLTFLPPKDSTLNTSMLEMEYGETIHISCPRGFTYNGTKQRTCQLDGSWSGLEGSCNVKTCPPYVPVGVGWVEPACSPCEYNDTVRVVCPLGYENNGAELTCDENGQWNSTIDECTGIRCTDDIGLANGRISGSGFEYPHEVYITCDAGYRWEGASTIAVCTNNGSWTFSGSCIALKMEVRSNTSGIFEVKILVIALSAYFLALIVVIAVAGLLCRRCLHRPSMPPTEADPEESLPLRNFSNEMSENEDKAIPKNVGGPQVQNTEKPVLQKTIISYGHVTNRDKDKKIDLDTQFITLRLVSGGDSDNMNDIRPDLYQDYLQKAGGKNIEIKDLLKYVKYDDVPEKGGLVRNEEDLNLESRQGHEDKIYSRQRRPILLEGRGGVGKSTLVQKLMRLWAQKKWATNYKAAFLFNIRSLAVVDKRPISLVNFFKFFGVYILSDERSNFIASSLKEEDNIIIFIDGVDEFTCLAERLHEVRKVGPDGEAEPITWCLNIIGRDVLGTSTLILATRYFKDLTVLRCDPVLEVVGLTRDTILQFIDCHVGQDTESEEEKEATIERVKKAMTVNPLVMSASAITYFCMLFCKVLEEDVDVSMKEHTTYTRIAAFIIQNYLRRNVSLPSTYVKPSSFLPPLSRLAYNGLVENRVNDDIARLVFDKTELDAVQLTDEHVSAAVDSGLLLSHGITQHREDQSETETRFTYEFVHLSVQELLAMMELSQKDTDTLIKTAKMMWKSSSFNMAKMYLYGLLFDTKNEYIRMVKSIYEEKAVAGGLVREIGDDSLLQLHAQPRVSGPEDILQRIQATYEAQNESVVKKVAAILCKDGDCLELSKTSLTVIDLKAIVFLLEHSCQIRKLSVSEVSVDESSVEILTHYLQVESHLNCLSLDGSWINVTILRNILHSFGHQRHQNILSLSRIDIGENAVMSMLVQELQKESSLTSLSLRDIGLTGTGLDAILKARSEVTDLRFNRNKLKIKDVVKLIKTDNRQLTHLYLEDLVDGDSILEVVGALTSNTSLQTLVLRGTSLPENTIKKVMKRLTPNRTLQLLWLIVEQGRFALVHVPGTNRRVRVVFLNSTIIIKAWTPSDIVQSAVLYQNDINMEGDELELHFNGDFSSVYGENRPEVSSYTWSHIWNEVIRSKDRVRTVVVQLSPSTPVHPLLTSFISHCTWEALIQKQVERMEVRSGTIAWFDLHTWYMSLDTEPELSIRSNHDEDGRVDGIELINKDGQSLVMLLHRTSIMSEVRPLDTDLDLLHQPEWLGCTE